jgi:transcriptional regulator with XRE-family HTH domain
VFHHRREIGPELGAELKAARQRAGLTYRAAAQRIGIAPGYLWCLEAGVRAPRIDTADRIIDSLRLEDDVADRLLDAVAPEATISRTDAIFNGHIDW